MASRTRAGSGDAYAFGPRARAGSGGAYASGPRARAGSGGAHAFGSPACPRSGGAHAFGPMGPRRKRRRARLWPYARVQEAEAHTPLVPWARAGSRGTDALDSRERADDGGVHALGPMGACRRRRRARIGSHGRVHEQDARTTMAPACAQEEAARAPARSACTQERVARAPLARGCTQEGEARTPLASCACAGRSFAYAFGPCMRAGPRRTPASGFFAHATHRCPGT